MAAALLCGALALSLPTRRAVLAGAAGASTTRTMRVSASTVRMADAPFTFSLQSVTLDGANIPVAVWKPSAGTAPSYGH